METLHGAPLPEDPLQQPLTVVLAVPRGQPKESVQDTEVPPHSRLFVTYRRTIPDEELQGRFAGYPDIEAIKILHAAGTQAPRGIAFVKFTRTSTALRAMEEVNEAELTNPTPGQPYRVKLAGHGQQAPQTHTPGGGQRFGAPYGASPYAGSPYPAPARGGGGGFGYGGGPGGPVRMPMHGGPPYGGAPQYGAPQYGGQPYGGSPYGGQPYGGPPTGPPFGGYPDAGVAAWKNPQLGAQRIDNNAPPGSRLWLSVSRRLPIVELAGRFGAFGFLESIHLLPGRNCGFAKYENAASAANACAALNGAELAPGVVAKVAVATPQTEGVTDPRVKRQRI